ncbi:MAG: CerR family C-terminal domain-containing protein [Aquabacterium sp.]
MAASPSRRARGTAAPPPAADDARARLLHAGLRLFAHHGFTKTRTRALAEQAQVNVAAISYYFGDKAGLYRAVFTEPMGSPEADIARFTGRQLTLPQALRGFYEGFTGPLRQGDLSRLCTRLHFREMLEPSGLFDFTEALGIEPLHRALLQVLCRHLGLRRADRDLHRLAVCLTALGVHLHVGRDIAEQLVPGILDGDKAIDQWADRLVDYGLGMVQAEARRRGLALRLGHTA